MTLYELSMKMLRSNYKKYKLLFICNTFTVSIFYTFASIFTNDEFMNYGNIDSRISSNIYAPSVFLAIFMLIFIPYSYQLFQKERKSEYGILMTLGMSQTEGIQKLLFETIVIGLTALLFGFIIGTGISALFYIVLLKAIFIAGIHMKFRVLPYEVTALYYLFIWIVTLIVYTIRSQSMQIMDWMKARFQRNRRSTFLLLCIGICLFGTSVFFSEFCTTLYSKETDIAMEYSPYDLLYSNLFGMNDVSMDKVKGILSKYDVTVTKEKELSYLRGSAFNLLSASEVNQTFHLNYQVDEGEFLVLYQFDLKDGYGHELENPKDIGIDTKKGEIRLRCIGEDVRILFNDNPTFADYTLILNDNDYKTIQNQSSRYTCGSIKMLNVQDWKTSKEGVEALQSYFTKTNAIDKVDEHYYKITSKINTYRIAKQSGQFLLFVMTFIIVLFFCAGNLVIHFKIQAELEEEKSAYRTLFRIGISDFEMIQIIHRKNTRYFLIPVMVGILSGVFLNGLGNAVYQNVFDGLLEGVCIAGILIILQWFLAKVYTKYEWRSIMSKN